LLAAVLTAVPAVTLQKNHWLPSAAVLVAAVVVAMGAAVLAAAGRWD
jgi:hypothetical protein